MPVSVLMLSLERGRIERMMKFYLTTGLLEEWMFHAMDDAGLDQDLNPERYSAGTHSSDL
jgi:hypothetical protein